MISLQLEKYLIEFIGTFFFLYVIISTGFHPIIIGGALALVIFSGGEISGGHFNPAVTIMMTAAKKSPMKNALPSIIAQIAGGLLALQLHKIVKFI